MGHRAVAADELGSLKPLWPPDGGAAWPALAGGFRWRCRHFSLSIRLKGWCPPLPVFRRLGVRTETEIQTERYALKALRGDFEQEQRHPVCHAGRVELVPSLRGKAMNTTTHRVAANTSDQANHWIQHKMERRLAFYAAHRELIEQRLQELDREWDVERVIETEGPATTVGGMLMSLLFGRKWLVLPIFAQSMVLTACFAGACTRCFRRCASWASAPRRKSPPSAMP